MVAYFKFPSVEHTMSPRSKMIATYALCGFSNPASIGITIASLSAMAPERRPDIVSVVLRAFVAGKVITKLLNEPGIGQAIGVLDGSTT